MSFNNSVEEIDGENVNLGRGYSDIISEKSGGLK